MLDDDVGLNCRTLYYFFSCRQFPDQLSLAIPPWDSWGINSYSTTMH